MPTAAGCSASWARPGLPAAPAGAGKRRARQPQTQGTRSTRGRPSARAARAAQPLWRRRCAARRAGRAALFASLRWLRLCGQMALLSWPWRFLRRAPQPPLHAWALLPAVGCMRKNACWSISCASLRLCLCLSPPAHTPRLCIHHSRAPAAPPAAGAGGRRGPAPRAQPGAAAQPEAVVQAGQSPGRGSGQVGTVCSLALCPAFGPAAGAPARVPARLTATPPLPLLTQGGRGAALGGGGGAAGGPAGGAAGGT